MTEHNAPNGTIYFHNAALSGWAHSLWEGEQKGAQEREPAQDSREDNEGRLKAVSFENISGYNHCKI